MGALTDLLTNSTARHALAQRDISAVFRILRDAGVSQIRLAHATGQQQSEISEIISGRQVQSIVLLERIADGLEIPRGWMGLAYAPDLVAEAAAADDAETEGERRSNLLRHAATLLYGKPVLGPRPRRSWKDFATALPHIEGCTYLVLGRFDRAAAAFTAAERGASHAAGCAMHNFGHLAAAQLRCGELRSGLVSATRAINLAKGLRSVWHSLAPLQQAAAARRDSACQDLARELATLRSAA